MDPQGWGKSPTGLVLPRRGVDKAGVMPYNAPQFRAVPRSSTEGGAGVGQTQNMAAAGRGHERSCGPR